jgi:MFS transporter, putative metabolite:H+ symporter
VNLFQTHGVGGVLALMIGLLVLQVVVVALFGVEPSRRGLEEIERASPGVPAASDPPPLTAPPITAERR